ncbi:MAG TPA: AEC family transporter [Candidatus Flavonifractor merdigallinarum]|uniref:AEC family transporter n=1 Tax=Candidatus Flavonifractor merdigallinarum TaxID=2838589 RepID=A0A9D1Y8F6_9FIRM|nr:AEC family transporter [Candidatus Flavonifractor merdigallinarum]
MELAAITLEKTIVMGLLALVGAVAYQTRLIDEKQNEGISELVLQLFTPILLFTSLQQEFTKEHLHGLLWCVLLGLLQFVLAAGIAQIVSHRQPDRERPVEQVALIYSNCGFVGIPLALGILGDEGVFYMSVFVAMSNLLIWTHGVFAMSGRTDRRFVIRSLTSPTILAIVAGMVFFAFQWRLPNVIEEPLEMFAAVNTPLAMMVAGVNIARENRKSMLMHKRLYLMCAVKLLVIPLVFLAVMQVIPVSDMIRRVAVLCIACPTGVTSTLLAMRYEKNAAYGTDIFAMTTLCSVVTLPLVMMFC